MSAYASLDDLFRFGMSKDTRGDTLTDDVCTAALSSASATADSYLRGRYAYPLLAWGDDLKKYVCWVAAYELLSGARGFNADAGGDSNLLSRHDAAIEWFTGVQAKRVHPDITPSPNQSPTYDQPFVISSSVVSASGRTCARRGW
jgi:phage gp36-like protein